MFTDPNNPLHNEILSRRGVLKERILELIKHPNGIKSQQDVLFVEKYDEYLAVYFYSPSKNREYQTVPLGSGITEESKHLIFCYERNWEEEGYNQSTPVIELKDGRQIECGILDLNDFEDGQREEVEMSLNEIQRIIAEENATMKE